MMHATEDGSFTPQQVEFNTISAGMACLSSKVSDMHAYLVSRHAPQYAAGLELPVNAATKRVVQTMARACHQYESQSSYRVGGQRAAAPRPSDTDGGAAERSGTWWISSCWPSRLWKQHSIPLVRKTLTEVHDEAAQQM